MVMTFESLDPRIKRWNLSLQRKEDYGNGILDQLPTYEVFLQLKEGKAYEHVGIVHAASDDMAFLFAKEQFSRRYTCTGMWVVPSNRVWVTDFTELEESVYDHIKTESNESAKAVEEYVYEVFHLFKRGKQHKHAGQVQAHNHRQALVKAKAGLDNGKPVLNIWLIKTDDITVSSPEDRVIWSTLPEKTHREVISYRAGDKLKSFKEKTK